MPGEVAAPLAGQVIVVTGAAGGIGTAIVAAVTRAGARAVIAADRDPDGLARLAAGHGRDCELVPVVADVSEASALPDALAREHDRLGQLDGLVVASGISSFTHRPGGTPMGLAPATDLDPQLFADVLGVNFYGFLHASRAFARELQSRRRGGSIVSLSSIAATRAVAGNAPYCVSKAAARMLMKCLALELAGSQIRVNSVAPGYVRTAMLSPAFLGRAADVPLGRIAEPEDIAPVVTFLLSPAGAYLTGTEISADGGVLAAVR
jgi:2,3-dihydro-2,3-dihydroxybenzoate dehydrogenase